MPHQRGSETRVRNHNVGVRWDDAELAELDALQRHTGLSRAALIRRLVSTAGTRIVLSREHHAAINKLGVNGNQIARALNTGDPVTAAEITALVADLRAAVRTLL
ncbi:ribbon-helix-helix protein, CopG family [Glacieibacterium frigidum]|uniref:Plasmid mobilization relaxosome protein MobC n=1 Tax=Glacieibacterium frigidum TaxID=2593303 RepID=A0A552UHN6_9SPHN|nr:ribbon-helix-helix protein, CopG family [Glacieibacterium frigidum]TRW17736.1 plasmid mobilization relaxosome protein MobC [Glacieibacterium frigidum]